MPHRIIELVHIETGSSTSRPGTGFLPQSEKVEANVEQPKSDGKSIIGNVPKLV